MKSKSFLKVQGRQVVHSHNAKVLILSGVNLGGWLMMEGYILHALNTAEQLFKKKFVSALGASSLKEFEKAFRDHFIQEEDFKKISQFGFNCVRLPFNCRLIESSPYRYDKQGLKYLDQAVSWAKKYKLWIILDLHAAPGAQNHDWHSDSLGQAQLWTKKENQKRTYALWKFLANHFKDEESIAGYDLLNEAVLEDTALLNRFYNEAIQTIRSVDKNHIIFVEGARWALDIDGLDDFEDDNLILSVHNYQPFEFTFNFIPHLKYPLEKFGKKNIREILLPYDEVSREKNRPIHVGEFGVNYRAGVYAEEEWLRDTLRCYQDFGFHWTYWTYKAVKNSVFPDGIFSLMDNPPWVNRAGPKLGWDNYADFWPTRKKDIIASWQTKSFSENIHISNVLKDAVKKNNQFT